ncbi:MAG: NADH-quinone oxidoreductase subunit NuoE [Azospirillum sp.]|nr:NADH-quinone oxidoreductase subunit NuoE [Azospirillum sp.]
MSSAAAIAVEQPESFAFSPENRARAERIVAKYPPGRQASAVLPLLDLAQRQSDNWLPRAAMDHVAEFLSMPRIRVYEVATFYTMFNKTPVGKHFVQICTTTPCWLRGSADLVHACERKLGISMGETTPDNQFTVIEAECLGACVNAPMVQIGDHYYEDLDGPGMEALLDALARGEVPAPGSQIGRSTSCSVKGPTTLLHVPKRQASEPEAAPAAEPDLATAAADDAAATVDAGAGVETAGADIGTETADSGESGSPKTKPRSRARAKSKTDAGTAD